MTDDRVLDIGGMTCSSCAARVEKRLNRLPGVVATVNLATEKVFVSLQSPVSTAELIAAVESAGYSAAEPAAVPEATDETPNEPSAMGYRLLVSAALALPVALLSMIPALQFFGWQWVALALAAPVAIWGAYPFHRAALVNARHGAASMDTLVGLFARFHRCRNAGNANGAPAFRGSGALFRGALP